MGASARPRLSMILLLKREAEILQTAPGSAAQVFHLPRPKRLSQFGDVEGVERAGELVNTPGVHAKRIYIAADRGISFLQPLTATMAARATSTPPSTSTT